MKTYINKTIYIKSNLRTYRAKITPSIHYENRVLAEISRRVKWLPFCFVGVTSIVIDVNLNDSYLESASKIIRNIEDTIKTVEEEVNKIALLEKSLESESSITDRLKE